MVILSLSLKGEKTRLKFMKNVFGNSRGSNPTAGM
jgi:hypothetical protein